MRSVSELIRVVADTNLIVSGLITKHNLPYQFVETVRAGGIVLVLSAALYAEYARVLPRRQFVEKYGLNPEEVTDFLRLIAETAWWVAPAPDPPVTVRDAKDAMVLATALSGEADYLVTGDQDLLVLRSHPALGGLRIVTVREFLDITQPPLSNATDG